MVAILVESAWIANAAIGNQKAAAAEKQPSNLRSLHIRSAELIGKNRWDELRVWRRKTLRTLERLRRTGELPGRRKLPALVLRPEDGPSSILRGEAFRAAAVVLKCARCGRWAIPPSGRGGGGVAYAFRPNGAINAGSTDQFAKRSCFDDLLENLTFVIVLQN